MMRKPNITQTAHALKVIAKTTGARRATYCFEGRFLVSLPGGWALVLSADDAGRFRLDACLSGRVRATMWCLADDDARLAELASAAQAEATALVA